jgi:hypothetical protein
MDITSDMRRSNTWVWVEVSRLGLRLPEIGESDMSLRSNDMLFPCHFPDFLIKGVR